MTTMGLHQINVGETQIDFAKDEKTDYTIVTPAQADSFLNEAAVLLIQHVASATGAQLPVETDAELTWSQDKKWIVLGSEKLFAGAGLTMPEEDVGTTGYYIRTVGNSVFVMSKGTHGVQNGALEFLRHTVGYEMYADDTVVYSVERGDDVRLPDFDIIDRPDFTYYLTSNRMSSDAVVGMRFTSEVYIPVNGEVWHNSFCYLNPDDYPDHPEWFSEKDKTQLCYTARGIDEYYDAMLDEFMTKMIPAVESRPDLENITITIQDNTDACRCDACTAEYEKYGTDSAAVIKFCNSVSDRLEEYFTKKAEQEGGEPREVNILFFAYRKMFTPPVKKVNESSSRSTAASSAATTWASISLPSTRRTTLPSTTTSTGRRQTSSKAGAPARRCCICGCTRPITAIISIRSTHTTPCLKRTVSARTTTPF